jgi:alanine racemase
MTPGPVHLTLGELATVVGGELTGDTAADSSIALGPHRVVVHSDIREPGAIFVALAGKRDGHAWVTNALANGASCAVVRHDWPAPDASIALVRVGDPLAALHALARWYRRQLQCRVIAVAGSVGKTTTKDALVSFFGETEYAYGSPGSFNSQIGVPLAMLWCPHDATVAVIEVAATEPGEMARLADVVRPSTVVITRVGGRFRRNFGSVDTYAEELCALAADVSRDGLVICGDDAIDLAPYLSPDVRLLSPRSETWPIAGIERAGAAGMNVLVRAADSRTRRIEVATSSAWLAEDVAVAAATVTLLDAPLAATFYSPASLGLQTWRSPGGVYVLRTAAVDDPMAWRAAIADASSAVGAGGRVFVVLDEPVNALSDETLLTLTGVDTTTPIVVLATTGRAASLLVDRVATRVFESSAELGRTLMDDVRPGDVVAVVAGRGQLIDDMSRDLFEAMAPTKLFIDVGAIEINLSILRRQCPTARIMAVVKAGAYGVDAVELARHLVSAGVDAFAVSHADEGTKLRRSGISAPVLVLLATPDELDKAYRSRLTICIHSDELLRRVLENPSRVVGVHVELDTGMHRTGLEPRAVAPALVALRAAGVPVTGLMSHLAAADDPAMDDFTRAQFRVFDDTVLDLRAQDIDVPPRHILASAGIIRFPEHAMEMVRSGLAVLGISPSPDSRDLALIPSLTLVSRLIDRRALHPADRVGYGGSYVADHDLIAGVVQLGYHDGIFRAFANGGAVMINGKRCPIIGRISMDSLVVDLSACPDAAVGSDVLVFGAHGGSSQSIEDVAAAMQTISYEVISRLGPRVQRIFVRH